MRWDELENKWPVIVDTFPSKKTDIDCPDCGKKIYMWTDVVLDTYPPQYQYECECGWVGYSFAKYENDRS